ncbi:hypothetical protein GGE06_005164 [Streptomyces sp. SFB5A]|uniref:Uncharacterized protein n=1 Tax=Streptomyces nymphaeiformis TaxID=2663842 RepID=A0A7W7U383_9ACTN|nr:hypothetical protein [Streptomyces nymphaeiformis]
MPADHARKGPVRRRQATTGESYTEAAKALRRSYNLPVWDPWVAPRCEEDDPIPGHDSWVSGPCPEGCPARERPDYIAYLETLPPAERLPRPAPAREPYVCPGQPSCIDDMCPCNYIHIVMCSRCEWVYAVWPEGDAACPGCRPLPG